MVSTEVRVRYADTDAMGVVYHANYLVWFEVGRTEFMRAVGIPYTEFEARDIMVPVVDASIKWLAPARYDDQLRVETRVAAMGHARIQFSYRIVRISDDRCLCEGQTTHGFITREGRPIALAKHAPDFYAAFQARMEPKA